MSAPLPAQPSIPARRRGGVMIMPYMGYANDQRLVVRGRVLRERTGTVPLAHASGWRNFMALTRLARSAKVAGATVLARFRSGEHEAVTDDEGYFGFDIALTRRLARDIEIDLELAAPPVDSRTIVARAPVRVPPASARLGVISDIDDTIVWTHVGNRRRMLWTLARSNAATRKPFTGVAAFYRALHDGAAGDEGNPVFYVSSGPWNLYPALVDFMRINEIPQGPLFLKDWGRHMLTEWRDHGTHKLAAIREILHAFSHLPFVLVGDSGEQDPEIYRDAVLEFPGRIAAVYIRSVDARNRRIDEIQRVAEQVRDHGSVLLLVDDSRMAAAHAAQCGYLAADRLHEIEIDQRADEMAPLPAAAIDAS
jgi:phosphatidate phosphatase APP1